MSHIVKIGKMLDGKTAVVTGAGSGIGRDMTLNLLNAGWSVCAIDVDERALQGIARHRATSSNLTTSVCDVTDYNKLAGVISAFHEQTKYIGLLINAAGIGGSSLVEEFKLSDWKKVLDTNILGVVNACHVVLPYMKQQNTGHICSIASAAAYHSLPRLSAYNMSKAAVVSLTETLQAELADTLLSASVMISAFYKSNIAEFTLGGDESQMLAKGLIRICKMTSTEAATKTLQGIAQGKTYILVGSQARLLYRLKRFFPNFYGKLSPRIARAAFEKARRAMD